MNRNGLFLIANARFNRLEALINTLDKGFSFHFVDAFELILLGLTVGYSPLFPKAAK